MRAQDPKRWKAGLFVLAMIAAGFMALFSVVLSLLATATVWIALQRQGPRSAWVVWAALALVVGFLFLPLVADASLAEDRNLAILGFVFFGAQLASAGVLLRWGESLPSGSALLLALGASLVPLGLGFLWQADGFDQVYRLVFGQAFAMLNPYQRDELVRMMEGPSIALLPVLAGLGAWVARHVGLRMAGWFKPFVLAGLRLPVWGVWIAIAAVAGMALVVKGGLGWKAETLITMGVLSTAMAYALQGLGIVQYWLVLRGRFGFARILLPLFLGILALLPGLNVLVGLALAVLGVAETWFPWRTRNQETKQKET